MSDGSSSSGTSNGSSGCSVVNSSDGVGLGSCSKGNDCNSMHARTVAVDAAQTIKAVTKAIATVAAAEQL